MLRLEFPLSYGRDQTLLSSCSHIGFGGRESSMVCQPSGPPTREPVCISLQRVDLRLRRRCNAKLLHEQPCGIVLALAHLPLLGFLLIPCQVASPLLG